jgi:hypothetical protein
VGFVTSTDSGEEEPMPSVDALVGRDVVCLHIDVSKLRFCTAAGVEVLEAVDAEVTRRGGGLWLQGAAGVVARVFQVLGVRQERPSRVFPGVASADGAPSTGDQAADTVTTTGRARPCRSR